MTGSIGRLGPAAPPPPLAPGDLPIAILVDYDGTVAQTDVSDALMAEFVTDEWEARAAEYDAGLSGSRRITEWEVGLITARPEALRALAAAQPRDPHALVRLCIENGWPFRRWTEFTEIEAWTTRILEAWRVDPESPLVPRRATKARFCGPDAWGKGRWDPPAAGR